MRSGVHWLCRLARPRQSVARCRALTISAPDVGKTRPRRALPAPLTLTADAEKFLRILHGQHTASKGEVSPNKGYLLSINQAPNNMHMVFSFDFIDAKGVTARTVISGKAGSSGGLMVGADKVAFAEDDSLALYIDSSALMKVLGATVDFDHEKSSLVILDADGNELSPEK